MNKVLLIIMMLSLIAGCVSTQQQTGSSPYYPRRDLAIFTGGEEDLYVHP